MMTDSKTESYGSRSVTVVTREGGKQVTKFTHFKWAGGDGVERVVDVRDA